MNEKLNKYQNVFVCVTVAWHDFNTYEAFIAINFNNLKNINV